MCNVLINLSDFSIVPFCKEKFSSIFSNKNNNNNNRQGKKRGKQEVGKDKKNCSNVCNLGLIQTHAYFIVENENKIYKRLNIYYINKLNWIRFKQKRPKM